MSTGLETYRDIERASVKQVAAAECIEAVYFFVLTVDGKVLARKENSFEWESVSGRTFVQISAATGPSGGCTLFCLGSDGTLWKRRMGIDHRFHEVSLPAAWMA